MVKDIYVASCVYDGAPLIEAEFTHGYLPCPECKKLMGVKIKHGRITVTDVSGCPEMGTTIRTYMQSRNERKLDR